MLNLDIRDPLAVAAVETIRTGNVPALRALVLTNFVSALRLFALALGALLLLSTKNVSASERPNIIFILADDLGYGDLGCYGQQKIRTPNIDRLAAEGMKFTQHYAGNNVCAPSRCVLMTGQHPGHAVIRDNRQAPGFSEGQTPVPAGTLTLPLTLKKLGYQIGGFGKWGLGPTGSSGAPLKQGFDRWFGYNCQAVAHNYYPTHLWDDERQLALDNPAFPAHQALPKESDPNDPASYERYRGRDYAPDLIGEQSRAFVRANRDRPFFLYMPTTVPHLALQVPEDSLAEYTDELPDEPYVGDRRYLPHPKPHAAYAAMISRMDREVGSLLDLVRELGLADNTIVVFTSDNGPLSDRLGGTDTEFFNSAAGLRGHKGSFYEGGFRVPCLVCWPEHIKPGSQSDRVTGFEDWLPTLLELIGATEEAPATIDGISFASTLSGKAQPERPFLYRESPGYGGQQAVRVGRWKVIRTNLHPARNKPATPPGELELYDLVADPSEEHNVAPQHSEIVSRLEGILKAEHARSELFPIAALDNDPG